MRFSAGTSRSCEEDLVGVLVDHRVERFDLDLPRCDGGLHVHEEYAQSACLVLELGIRGGAREQEHQVGVLRARDEHLLAVDDVAVALPDGRVSMRVVSDPAFGSVTANVCSRSSPLATRGK